MRSKSSRIIAIMALCLVSLAGWTVYGQKQQPTPRAVWEYKVVSETDKISLNDMGAQGWELVTVEMGGAQEVYYFKRVK